jgi:predicted XRE-type DNA-binding protein
VNTRERAFHIRLGRKTFRFPFVKADPTPTANDPIVRVYADPELAHQGFSFVLASGKEGSVLADQVLEYNRDPRLLRKLALHQLTARALEALEQSKLSKREIIRCLGTSPSQFYRLIDPANYQKTIDQMLALLNVLGCEVEFTVRKKSA